MSDTATQPTVALSRGGRMFQAARRVDLDAGRAEFEISGRGVAGVIMLEPGAALCDRFDPTAYRSVKVTFGRAPVGAKDRELTDSPVINRVKLRHGSFNVNPAHVDHTDAHDVRSRMHRENSDSECPAVTKQFAADVVLALVGHCLSLPEWPELAAAYLRRTAAERIEEQHESMAAATRTLEECARVVEVWRAIGGDRPEQEPADAEEAFEDEDEYDELEDEAGYEDEDEYEEEDPEEAEARRDAEADQAATAEQEQPEPPRPYYEYCPHFGGTPGTCEDCQLVRGHDAMFDFDGPDEADQDQEQGEDQAATIEAAKAEAGRLITRAVDIERDNPYVNVRARVRKARITAHDARADLLRAVGEEETTGALAALIAAGRALRGTLAGVPAALSFALGAAHSGDAVHLAWGFAGDGFRGVWCSGEQNEEITLTIAELPGTSTVSDSDVIDALAAHEITLSRLCRHCFSPTTRVRYVARLKVTAMRAAEQLAAAG